MLRFFVLLPPAIKNACAVFFLAFVTVCLFWPLLFGDQILFFGDISLYFTPLLHFQQGETVGQGRIPLWNPMLLCGTPFVGNPQAWPLYPTSLLLYWLPVEKIPGMIGAVHIFGAAWGTYAFLLARGRSRWAALMGAMAWGFGGVLVSKMQFPNMVQAVSWLPWLLLACERVLVRPTPGRGAVLGLMVGLALLAAHPQMFLLQFYLALAWCLWRLSGLKEGRQRRFAFLTIGFTLGIGLAAAQLLPTLEMVRHSVRPDLPLEKANRFILAPYAVLTNFLAPDFYGNPAFSGNPYVGRGNFWEPCCYLGILPFFSFVYGAIVRFREAETRFWLLAALVGIWLAVGRDAGLFGVAFYVLPGINRFHDAARFLFPATFAIVCLAASGFDSFLLKLPPRQKLTVAASLLLLTVADLAGFSRTLNPTMGAREFRKAIYYVPGDVSPDGRLFQADEGKIWGAFISYQTYEALSSRGERRAFLQSLAPNLPVLGGWRDAAGYEPVRLASVDSLLEPVKNAVRQGRLRSKEAVLDALAVNQIASWDRIPGKTRLSTRYQRPRAARALLWSDWRNVGSLPEAFGLVNAPGWDGVPVVVSDRKPILAAEQVDDNPLVLGVTDTSPDQVTMLFPLPHPAGLIVLADAGYPGWHVTVDGKSAESLCVNGAFRGVFVGKDASVVTWRYDPGPWRLGLFVSLLAVGIMAVMVVPSALACIRRRGLTSQHGTI